MYSDSLNHFMHFIITKIQLGLLHVNKINRHKDFPALAQDK